MLFGLGFLIILIFLILVGISIENYQYVYWPIFMITLGVYAGIMATAKDDTKGGWPPIIIFIGSMFVWTMAGCCWDIGQQFFSLFMFIYITIVLGTIIYYVIPSKTDENTEVILNATIDIENDFHEKFMEILRTVQEQSNSKNAALKQIDNKASYAEVIYEEIEEVESSEDTERAQKIIDSLPWERLNILDKGRVQYCVTQKHAPDASEFEWLLGYISDNGTPENPNNPCSYVITKLNGTEYKTVRTNKYFKTDVLYKFGEMSSEFTVHAMNCLDAHNRKLQRKLDKSPIYQYKLEELSDKNQELKQKISEYKRMRKQQSDPVFISLSTRNLIDMDEYEQQLQDLKDEIEDIRTDIEDIKYDIEDIRDEVEYELN